ncbi:MAG: alpha/beta hydrolase, partial [Nocardioides sp.]|nr:alpha/beta hydrolase [Nocardioides sp.]
MTTIQLPAQLAPMQPLRTSPGAVRGVLTNIRASGLTLSNSWTTTSGHGIPGDWSGATATSAGYAFTQFGQRSDAVSAALEKASLAIDVYADTVTGLELERERLDQDRTTLNQAVNALRSRIDGSGADADVAALESEAARLRERHYDLEQDEITFWAEVDDAEDRCAQALRAVDSDAEATDAAASPGRPDVASLLTGLTSQPTPDAVNDYWNALTPAEQEALKIHDPGLVGNTDGIPTGDRDEANRSLLEKDEEYLTSLQSSGQTLTDGEQQSLVNVNAAIEGIKAGETTLDPRTGDLVDTHLILYRPHAYDGDGVVAISYGDPDTADNTAVVVPGLTNDGSMIASQGEDALNLLQAAGGEESTAVIAWMGYDAPSGGLAPEVDVDANPIGGVGVDVRLPNIAGVGAEQLATEGGANLSQFVDGLRATHEGDPGNLSVIGHSYGSTTVAHAATDGGLNVDSLSLVGSPGAGSATSAADLDIPTGKVYVGTSENDFVTWLGGDTELGMGLDPSQDSFGAT